MSTSRPRIAFLVRTLHDRTGADLWKGVLERCRQRDLSVVAFKGGQLGSPSAASLYEAVDPAAFDGVITWASSELDDSVEKYYRRFAGKPLVGLTLAIPGRPVVAADNRQGMYELTEHFIARHGCGKIAYVRAPLSHAAAKARFEGFVAALRAHGLSPDERLISSPLAGWGVPDGAAGAEELVGSRKLLAGKDFDAILAPGDNLAIGVMQCLGRRGIRIPEDAAVGGFNASPEGRCMSPPLTSIAVPFDLQGAIAVDEVLSLLSGEKVPEEMTVPATLVVGQSCGCGSLQVAKAGTPPRRDAASAEPSAEAAAKAGEARRGGFARHARAADPRAEAERAEADWGAILVPSLRKALLAVFARHRLPESQLGPEIGLLLEAYHAEICEGREGAFLNALRGALGRGADRGLGLDSWQDAISELRAGTSAYANRIGASERAEDLWHQARVAVGEITARKGEAERLAAAQAEAVLRSIGASLITSFDLERIMDVLASSLAKLGIPGYYLALYDDQAEGAATGRVPEHAALRLAGSGGKRLALPPEGRRFRSAELVPADLLPRGRAYSLLVESLLFQDRALGYVVFETGPEDGGVYLALRDQLCSALYGALILADRARIRSRLELALREMSEKAGVVSEQSERIDAGVSSVSAAMEEFAANVREISSHAKTVAENVAAAESLANEAESDIRALTKGSARISEIVGIIDDIAEKTNVLALNAAIEAARAGQAGKGFGVVAKAVKELAARIVESTAQIRSIVQENARETASTSQAIARTTDSVQAIAGLSTSIEAAIDEQARAGNEISRLLLDASQGTSEISRAIAEIAKLGHELKLE